MEIISHMAEEHHYRKEVMPFDEKEAIAFVGKNVREIHWNPKDKKIHGWSACIDGREERRWGDPEDPLPPERFPGGGLGLLMSAYAGLANLERDRGGKFSGKFSFDPALIAETVEKTLGGEVSFHTDASSEEKGLPPAAGCGHLAGALSDPARYLLPEEVVSFLKDSYLPKLREETEDGDLVVYKGEHAEAAVFIIEADDVGLPSESDGRRAYVYSRALHREALREIAVALLPVVADKFTDVTAEDLAREIIDAADVQTAFTVERLAARLPKFRVFRDREQILVEKMVEKTEEEKVSDIVGESAGKDGD